MTEQQAAERAAAAAERAAAAATDAAQHHQGSAAQADEDADRAQEHADRAQAGGPGATKHAQAAEAWAAAAEAEAAYLRACGGEWGSRRAWRRSPAGAAHRAAERATRDAEATALVLPAGPEGEEALARALRAFGAEPQNPQ